MKRTLLVTMLFVLGLMLSSLWAVALSEGFEGTVVPPAGWTMSYADPAPPAGNLMIHTTEFAHSGTKSFRFSSLSLASNGMYDQYLVTPLLMTSAANTTLSFWYKGNTFGAEVFKVGWSSTNNNPTSFTWSNEISVPVNTAWTQYVKTDVPVGTTYMAIHYYSDYMWYVYVDDVVGPDIFATDIDMQAVSISGSISPTASAASPYTIVVKNMGNLSASGYTVKLFKEGDVEIASIAGTTLASGAETSYILNWTPTAAGATYLYGKVVMPGDANAVNDVTTNLSVVVQPAGVTAISIGTGSATNNTIPIDMYYQSSISETIYPSTAINLGGQLTGLSWYNTFVTTTLQNMPTKIWVGETTQTNLTAGWIPSTALTSVFDGTVNYPAGQNVITISFTTPYTYSGGNLVIMASRPMDTDYYSSSDMFFVSTGTAACTREYHSDTVAADPTAPPAGNILALYPNVTLYFLAGGGFVTGTVTTGGNPLAGATVHLGDGPNTSTTDAAGVYHLNYVPVGTHPVIAEKHGYAPVTYQVAVTEGNTATQNFALVQLPLVTVTGHVVANTAPEVGIAGATIELSGYEPYTATTNASGDFTIAGVYANQTYNYTVSATGFQPASGTVVVAGTNVNMGTLMVTEIMLPAAGVQAALNAPQTAVDLTWMAPGTGGGEWIEIDTGINDDGIGTGGVADFDIAARWSPADLTDYVGMSLYSVKFYPKQATATFSIRVWTGGTSTAPGTMVVDQVVAAPTIDAWNTVALDTPVMINSGQELWIGVRVNATAGYCAGCDAGPAHDGIGNMMYWQGAWTTLLALAPSLNYDWNIAGYVGYSAPTMKNVAQNLVALPFNADRHNTGTLSGTGKVNHIASASSVINNDTRPLLGYKVWRLLVGQETNTALWTQLTPNAITALTYVDEAWPTLAMGDYKWAVRAVYSGDVLAVPAFSNVIPKVVTGTLTGTVEIDGTDTPIAGALITAGTVTATSNAAGVYTMAIPLGTYTVTCSKMGYVDEVQSNVIIAAPPAVTTLNFELSASAIILSDSFENYPDFSLAFDPWTLVDVDGSATYGMTGTTWPGSAEPQAFIIFNPTTTVPPVATGAEAHTGTKYAACFASTTPPNNDWMIMPRIHIGSTGQLKFWAKSFTAQYGLERFKVGVSTTGMLPANFTIISPAPYVSAPIVWTEYTYDLAAYANQNVYLGLNCVSNDAFIMFIDDVSVDSPGGYVPNSDPVVTPVLTSLGGNYPNPFNPTTIIKYAVKQTTPVSITVYNVKGQLVKTLVNEVVNAGDHTVSWNGTDDNNRAVSSGVYFYKMNAGKYSSTKKMIMMK